MLNKVFPVFFISCIIFSVSCENRYVRMVEQADEHALNNRPEEALNLLDKVIHALRDDNNPETKKVLLKAMGNAGRISHLYLNSPERALMYYRQIVELSPDSEDAFSAREIMGRISFEAGDHGGALSHYQALVAAFLDREGIDRYQFELIRIYFTLGDFDQVRTESRYLLERWPETVYADRVRMLTASSHHIQGNFEEAAKAYSLVREKTDDPELAARALFEEAGCLASLDRKEEALKAYLEALENHPEPRLVRMRLERLKARMARRDIENLESVW